MKTAATIQFVKPRNYSSKGVKQIAAWLRKQAKALEKDYLLYDDKIKIKYLY